MTQNKEVVYRVYDNKNNYQQSYSAKLDKAFNWARDCANRTNGKVHEVTLEDGKEVSSKIIYDKSEK
ncbi:MAG: hypothetical protein RJB16_1003 [Bacteroidota bacterium]|jgi:hypothetical protein